MDDDFRLNIIKELKDKIENSVKGSSVKQIYNVVML